MVIGITENVGLPGTTVVFIAKQGHTFAPVVGTGAEAATTFNFRMRAKADPGPGYVHWNTTGTPDFAGTGAGSAIQAGTVVVVAEWET
ncbi:hypothetical protein LCGC14_0427210 [marine sediment metagenome]|uniref:Uncharacterized protein n=1 Tax=marine sediment metagenome TaxID=412755 RepID=A0A0F9SVH7_9ZZZZ